MRGLRVVEEMATQKNKSDLMRQVRLDFLRQPWWQENETIVVGVSGGLDSMALLEILFRLRSEFPAKMIVGHVNYHLRGEESNQAATHVQKTCKKMGILYKERNGSEVAKSEDNLQNAARKLRKDFFCKLAKQTQTRKIFLAHQQDDQVETVLLQLLRGTGLLGLAGMEERRMDEKGYEWVRPLLSIPRSVLKQWVKKEKIRFMEDSSNKSRVYQRNRVRHELMPLLESLQPDVRERFLNLSLQSRRAAQTFQFLAKDLSKHWGENEEGRVLFPRAVLLKMAPEVRRFLLRDAYKTLTGNCLELKQDHFERMDFILTSSKPRGKYPLPQGVRFIRRFEEVELASFGCNA